MKNREGKVVDRSVLQQEKVLISDAPQEVAPDAAPKPAPEVAPETSEAPKAAPETVETVQPAGKPEQPHKTSPNKRGRGKYILLAVVIVLLLLLTAFKVYVDNDYEAYGTIDTYQAMTSFEIERSDNVIAIQNMDAIEQKTAVGIIIYGDERVQRECYLPLMTALANQGYCVYLPTTFGNLPVLNQEGAEYVIRTYKSVKNWYLIAHGKACPVAARYAKNHASKLNGLIYLGGVSSHTDLSGKDLRLLSITGSLDTVFDQTSLQNAKANDPADSTYVTIEGGNHTCFLDTFLMRGDTAATISTSEQIEQTTSAITAFLQTVTP